MATLQDVTTKIEANADTEFAAKWGTLGDAVTAALVAFGAETSEHQAEVLTQLEAAASEATAKAALTWAYDGMKQREIDRLDQIVTVSDT